jgi:GTP-binding protein HflX
MDHSSSSPPQKKSNAILVSVQLPDVKDKDHNSSLEELSRLVHTLGYNVIATISQKRKTLSASSVVGEGKLKDISKWTSGSGVLEGFTKHTAGVGVNEQSDEDFEEVYDDEASDENDEETDGSSGKKHKLKADFVVFDNELSPMQSKNLEDALGAEVMDRTGVIVEIFHRHAKTPAAKAQVEIARLTYLTPRIRATGGGDRQGGGIGAKGAGETQHELDKRRIRDRIAELRKDLERIHRDEGLRRDRRKENLKLALVGYTNAGKSSLMRALTGSDVLVADKLFATLDTTVRAMYPESKPRILVSDTVGFIKKLPHDLVASFRSTLDEALDASLLLFVVDASDPSFRSQLETTKTVLGEIGANETNSLLILNKDDRLTPFEKSTLQREFPDAVCVSAIDPASVANLRNLCLAHFESLMIEETLLVPYSKGAAVAEMHNLMNVVNETHDEHGTSVTVRCFLADLDRIKKNHQLK